MTNGCVHSLVYASAPGRSTRPKRALQFELFNAKTDLKYVFHPFRLECSSGKFGLRIVPVNDTTTTTKETEIRNQ